MAQNALFIVYLAFAAMMLLVVLRKHLCTSCYYYEKLCSVGWGKLSSALFPKDSGSYELGEKLASLTWFTLIAAPIAGMGWVLATNYSQEAAWLAAAYLALTAIILAFHKRSCQRCRMRKACPLSI